MHSAASGMGHQCNHMACSSPPHAPYRDCLSLSRGGATTLPLCPYCPSAPLYSGAARQGSPVAWRSRLDASRAATTKPDIITTQLADGRVEVHILMGGGGGGVRASLRGRQQIASACNEWTQWQGKQGEVPSIGQMMNSCGSLPLPGASWEKDMGPERGSLPGGAGQQHAGPCPGGGRCTGRGGAALASSWEAGFPWSDPHFLTPPED